MNNSAPRTISGTVAATPVILPIRSYPVSMTLIPGVGNTSLCELTTSNLEGTPVWQPWPAGAVNTLTSDGVDFKITGLRFTRVSGSSNDVYEVVL